MLNSVLLHLEDAEQSARVIRMGVELAGRTEARVRGVTLMDTRSSDAAQQCETAVYAALELDRQTKSASRHQAARLSLSQACVHAGLNFDVRRYAGDPLEVLPREAKFHDLMITSVGLESEPSFDRLSRGDLAELLYRGAQPLLLVHPKQQPIQRVLLAYDGSEASGRAIRSYLNLEAWPNAAVRLLATGDDDSSARAALHEMADYCAVRCGHVETGCLRGKMRRILLPYAKKWQADLIVLGFPRSYPLVRRMAGAAAIRLADKLHCGLFAAT